MTAVFAFKRETLFTIKLTHKFFLLTIKIPPLQPGVGFSFFGTVEKFI